MFEDRGPIAPAPAVAWYLCDLVTGTVLSEVPFDTSSTIRSTIGKVDGQAFVMDVMDDTCPDDWASLLTPGKTMVVMTLADRPANAWVILDYATGAVSVPINASTLEECPSRTNVSELDAAGLDDCEAIAKLFEPVKTAFGFGVVWTPCGYSSGLYYSDLEDRTVLDAANDLNTSPGTPEWRIIVEWDDPTHRAFRKTVQIGPQVGRDRVDAIFDLDASGGGNIESYTRIRSYAAGKGATSLIGTSEASGSTRPMTDPITSPLVGQGWPRWEERVNFTGMDADTVLDEDAELVRRTDATLRQREYGTVTWSIVATADAPRPGVDYDVGDTVHVRVLPRGKQDPFGGSADMRLLGWEYDLNSGKATLLPWEDPEG